MENAGAYAEIGRRAGVYYEENASLAPHCSFGTGGNADVLFFPETKERAEELIARLDEEGLCYGGTGSRKGGRAAVRSKTTDILRAG